MPPFLFVVGIPRGPYSRIKRLQFHIEDWKVVLIPSKQHARAEWAKNDPEEILQRAITNPEGAHVLGFSQVTGRQRDMTLSLKRHLRFRWLSNHLLTLLHTNVDQFVAAIKTEAAFEAAWRKYLRPKDHWSPLLLPQAIFTAKRGTELWEQAAGVSPMPGERALRELERVARLADSFKEAHREHGYWIDAKDLKFEIGEHHASPPNELWMWKFSWRVQNGFHYDVSHMKGNEFHITDIWDETRHHIGVNGYINIDCHGRCRSRF